jgi:hypothetical protein
LQANGVVVRQAALESPEHIGRAERHGGILKGVLKRIIKDHNVQGKDQMKLAMSVALEVKNDTMRRDGFSPSQWVLAKHPRRPGSLLEEAEWGQLGEMRAQCDASTAFGLKAEMLFSAQKYFVHLDCGRRYAKAMLRKARHIPTDYVVGNVVMYKAEKQGARAPGDEWYGPARIIGFDEEVVWLQGGGQAIASAMHLLRPCSTSELLAWQVRNRNLTPSVVPLAEGTTEQEGYIDMRDDGAVGAAPKSSGHVVPEPEPLSKRQRQRQRSPQPQGRPADDLLSPLERHLEQTGVPPTDPGRRLVRSLASQSTAQFAVMMGESHSDGDGPKSSGHANFSQQQRRRRQRARDKQYACLLANLTVERGSELSKDLLDYHRAQDFFSDRISTEGALAYSAHQLKHSTKAKMKASLEKRGKLLKYNKVSPELQRLRLNQQQP